MRLIFGVFFGLLSLVFFYFSMQNEGPSNTSIPFVIGYLIGTHAMWVIFGIISFLLLKKKKDL